MSRLSILRVDFVCFPSGHGQISAFAVHCSQCPHKHTHHKVSSLTAEAHPALVSCALTTIVGCTLERKHAYNSCETTRTRRNIHWHICAAQEIHKYRILNRVITSPTEGVWVFFLEIYRDRADDERVVHNESTTYGLISTAIPTPPALKEPQHRLLDEPELSL